VVLLNIVSLAKASYKSLDPDNPIVFGWDHTLYQGKKITLGPRAFFIDGQLSNDQVAKYPYVFNSVNEAAKHLTDGMEDSLLLREPIKYNLNLLTNQLTKNLKIMLSLDVINRF
jgi:hypothetical protein